MSALAAHHTFLAVPVAGQTARGLQARLLDDESVVDAVPEGGRVRFVRSPSETGIVPLAGTTFLPTPPRFEDGFMVLLRRTQITCRSPLP